MDISPQHAQHIVDEMKRSIHRDMNIMNCQGIIIASTNPSRCGQLHQGASQLIAQGLRQKTVWQDDPAQGVQAGINLPIVITGELAGVIGITGAPEEVGIFGEIIKRMTEILLGTSASRSRRTSWRRPGISLWRPGSLTRAWPGRSWSCGDGCWGWTSPRRTPS